MPLTEPKLRVLVRHSAAEKDVALADELLRHLDPLRRFAGVNVWSEASIRAGDNWREQIRGAIDQADVALVLLSSDFLAAESLMEVEVPRILERHRAGALRVIPVLLRSCLWEVHPWLKQLKPLPEGGKAIGAFSGEERDEVLAEVAKEVVSLASASRDEVEPPRWPGENLPPTPPPTPITGGALHQLRAPPADFTGRTGELEDLRKHMGKVGAAIFALNGQGGVGKTVLALQFAAALAGSYPDAQIDLDLQGASPDKPLSPATVMRHVIHAFDPFAKLPASETELGALYRATLHNKRALLLFDNAKDRAQVEPLLPPTGCLVLVTSRQHFVLPGMYPKHLDTLLTTDALALVQRIAPRLDAASATTIAELCGNLPFALRLVASTLAERPNLKPGEHIQRLRTTKGRLELVNAVIKLSIDQLTSGRKALWCRLGVFPGDFDRDAAAAVAEVDVDEAGEALSDLLRESLLEWQEEADRYRLHDLARVYAREKLGEEERVAAERRHAEHFEGVARRADALYRNGGESIAAGLGLFDREWPNIATGQAWAAAHAKSDEAAARLASSYPEVCSYCLDLRQHPREQMRWFEVGAAAARLLGDHKMVGIHLGSMGLAHADLGEPRRALEFFEQQLAIAREIAHQPEESNALRNMGDAYAQLGEPRRAIVLFREHLAIARNLNDRRDEVNALGKLGLSYTASGEPRRAIVLHRQQLALARETGHRRAEGRALGGIGTACVTLGKPRRAILLHERDLAIRRAMNDLRGEGIALGNIGVSYAAVGDPRHAIEMHQQQLVIVRSLGNRLGEANASWNLGVAYEMLGERAKAIAAMQVCVDHERAIGHADAEKHAAQVAALLAEAAPRRAVGGGYHRRDGELAELEAQAREMAKATQLPTPSGVDVRPPQEVRDLVAAFSFADPSGVAGAAAAERHSSAVSSADARLQDLRAAYEAGNLVVFAGAGISAAAGLPTWRKLATDLLARLRAESKPAGVVAEVDDLLQKGQLVDALSAVKVALGPAEFDLAVEKACDDKGRPVPEAARALAGLRPRLRAAITTNLDRFLERAFEGEWDALSRATGDIASRRHYILKIHGTLLDRSTWVFSRDQYDRAVFAALAMRGAFEALFRTCPILFVGCGLADDDLDQTFAAVRALSGDQPPVHFALVPAGVPPFRRKKLEGAGLRLIEYANADGKHGEVAQILHDLGVPTVVGGARPVSATGGGAEVGVQPTPTVGPVAAPASALAQGTRWPAKLSGAEVQELVGALLSAFPTRSTLAQMVRVGLNENLDAITAGGNLRATVFELVGHVEAQGLVPRLFDAALAAAPGNPDLRALAAKRRM